MTTLWRMSWPAILEQLLGTLVSYVDTAMVGALGKTATAAVSINASSLWLVGSIFSGFGVAYSVQVANSVGAKAHQKARQVIAQSFLAVFAVGLAALLLLELISGQLPRWMGADAEVIPQAVRYLRFYALGLPGSALLYMFAAVLRCTGDTKTPLLLNGGANVCNMILNFFLIYPTRQATFFGHAVTIPGAGMGVAGAAAASAIAFDLAGALLMLVVIRRFQLFRPGSGDSLRPDVQVIRTAARLGLPYIAERVNINFGQIVMTRIVATIGTAALAAHQIAIVAEGLCYLPAYGISAAATALVGQAVGAGNREDADAYGILSGKIGFGLCLATGTLLFVFAQPLASIFTPDAEVIQLTTLILRIDAFAEPFLALAVVLAGAMRGALDVRYPMLLSMWCTWCLRVVLALLFVPVLHWGLAGAWIAMTVELTTRGLLCALYWRSKKWMRRTGLDRVAAAEDRRAEAPARRE